MAMGSASLMVNFIFLFFPRLTGTLNCILVPL